MPQRAMVRIWVASLHQETAPRNVSFWVLFVCSNPLFHDGKMTDCIPSDADLQKGFDGIPLFPGNE